MRITLLDPGTGTFYCGSCLRDAALAHALRERGHEALVVPLYLPFVLEESDGSQEAQVHMGGINVYLQQKLPLLRHAPRWVASLLDRPGLLRWAAAHGDMTDAARLGQMTLSMLRGEEGRQAHELDKLVDWLAHQERPDVLILSNVMLVGLARRLREGLDVPILCSMQGEAPFLDTLPQPFRDQAWEVLRERAGDVDGFVAVSSWYGAHLGGRLGVAPERVHVVHNAIDTRDFDGRREPSERPTIGYLARMCADKGLPQLVDAFLALRARGRVEGARLRVAGVLLASDEPLLAELKRRVADAGLAEDVEFLPNVAKDAKLEFLRTLDVLSVPAMYGESFGLYLLEALAAGVPVVQPRHAAFPEIIEATGGGVLYEPDDPGALAEALEGVLLDPEGARTMGVRGRAAVLERFDLKRMAREVEELCARV